MSLKPLSCAFLASCCWASLDSRSLLIIQTSAHMNTESKKVHAAFSRFPGFSRKVTAAATNAKMAINTPGQSGQCKHFGNQTEQNTTHLRHTLKALTCVRVATIPFLSKFAATRRNPIRLGLGILGFRRYQRRVVLGLAGAYTRMGIPCLSLFNPCFQSSLRTYLEDLSWARLPILDCRFCL